MKNRTNKLLSLLLAAVLLLALAAPALATQPLTANRQEYNGNEVTFIDFGRFAPQSGTSVYLVDDDVVIHYVPKNKTIYTGLHWGSKDDKDAENKFTRDFEFNADGTFDLRVSQEYCGYMYPAVPLKPDSTGATKSDYYLAIPAKDKIPPAPAPVDLEITNSTGMFKAVSASYSYVGRKLTVALSGTGYKNLYMGTYEEAVANGDKTENWIAATTNGDGRQEFAIPVADGETYMPVVAISQSYYEKYQQGQNPLERAFYPRQMTLDLDAKTLVTGDYESAAPLTVTNNATDFTVSSASLETVGGPNSNGYEVDLALTLGSDAFDKAYIGPKSEITSTSDTLAISEKAVSLKLKWIVTPGDPSTIQNLMAAPFAVSFHSASGDTWSEYEFTVSEANATLQIGEASAPAGSVALTITNGTRMFNAVSASYADGVLTMALNGDGYKYLFKGTYEEAVANGDKTENWIAATTNGDGKLEFAIPVAEGETYMPVVAVSQSYYEKSLNGENPLARAFYPRQLELDLTAATLVTGDYDHTATLTVTNNVKMFKVADTAGLRTVGGPNSNNYAVELQLTMGSDSFDKAFVGAKDAAAAAETTVAIDENKTFALPVTGITDSAFVASFHSVSEDAWYERQFTVDAAKATLVISPVEENSGSGTDDNSGSGNGSNSGTNDTAVDTSMYSKGTFTDVPFSIERATTGSTWHNVALPTCTVYVEDGAIYIDFTLERADKSKAPEYAWAETTVGRVTSVIDNEELTCSFKRLPVPSLGRVNVSMMTTAMSNDYVVDYVMIIDDSAIRIGGSQSGTPSTSGDKTDTATKTVTNDDGSVTVTTTNDDGSTTAVTTFEDGGTIVTDTAADGSVTEVKKDADGKVTEASATISESALAAAAEAGKPVTLALELPVAKDAAEAAPLTVGLPEGTDSAVVEIPVADVTNTSVVVLVNADGTEEILPRTALTENGLMVTLPAGATVKVVDNKQTFDDMPADAEEAEAIEFVAARGLMNGVGNGAFAPDLPMSRGMIATVLYRMERKPDATSAASFADVADGEWYSEAIAWAAEAGIVEGYGETFGVNDPVTTEQLIVMMWRMSGKPAAKLVETGAHDWAAEAMSWALSVGLIGEESTGENASAPATRGWVAVLVERFINLG